MIATTARNWWIWLVRGIASILFGIAAFLVPEAVIQSLILVFAAYALVDGVLSIIQAIQNRQRPRWWAGLIEGIISILAGLGAFLFPGMTVLIFLTFIAFWAIFTGVMEIIAAIQLRKEIEGEFWLALGGVLSVIAGILLLIFPLTGITTLLWLVGGYAIVFGVLMILLAFRVRNQGGSSTTTNTRATV